MSFFNTFDIASSGMTAQRKMMDVTAANLPPHGGRGHPKADRRL